MCIKTSFCYWEFHVFTCMQAPVVAEGPRKVPKILSKNRGSQLSKADILLNLRALEGPMATLIERTLKSLLPPADCSTVSKALGVLAVRDSKNGQAVLQVLYYRLCLVVAIAS